ncbi:protein suppressor 2 of zeste-like [Boleophthalmus pectinirostris]|uniref:protein suppressor 2 of zeste-like n=1 Tax=Boleophthalmus pectinirostris TaxID=150288 RepID=UPI002431F288|nr:protein suppressor 2 of zeste-like [Boleophthalmus pectinirostris]
METVKYQDSSKDSHDEKAAVSLGSITTKTVKVTSTGLVQGVIKATSKETKSSNHKNDTEDLKLTMISDHEPNIDCKTELANQTEEFKKAPSPESFDKNFASNDPPQKLNVSSTQEPDSMNHSHPSNNTTSNTKQNQNQTSTQQCVHDSGISAQLGARPLPEPETQALPEQANPHATPSLTTHELLLTPDQDPDICQPCTIREEIRLIPQIKGPPVPPQARDECARFTKPVSKATVMGGSPVTLEVEVAGQPEPTLTWCKDDTEEEELDAIAENQSCEEESVMDGALCEAWLTAGAKQDKNSTGDEDGEDRGLMAEVYDIIMTDWQTWFGTLCFLLWLLFLIVV